MELRFAGRMAMIFKMMIVKWIVLPMELAMTVCAMSTVKHIHKRSRKEKQIRLEREGQV